jgi:hypothetical protein
MTEVQGPAAVSRLGRYLTRGEAETLADRLTSGESIISASKTMAASRRQEFRDLVKAAGLAGTLEVANILRAVAGAKSRPTMITPLWTMPGALAQSGPLTTSIADLVEDARMSITCATFNFQESSQFWNGLRDAARRPEISLKVYVDRDASAPKNGFPKSPTAEDVAAQLHPGRLLRTRKIHGTAVRSHAKFLAVDHRFLVLTSANFSWSAEYKNVEFGVLIDSVTLTESVEREMDNAEDTIYELVPPTAQLAGASP